MGESDYSKRSLTDNSLWNFRSEVLRTKSTENVARNANHAMIGHNAIRSVRVCGVMASTAITKYKSAGGRTYDMKVAMSMGTLVVGTPIAAHTGVQGDAAKGMVLSYGTS